MVSEIHRHSKEIVGLKEGNPKPSPIMTNVLK